MQVVRTIRIAAPQREVFDFVADHKNALRFIDNLKRFEPRGTKQYGLGAKFYWETALRGLRIGWEFVVSEFVPPSFMSAVTMGRPRSTCSWSFEAVDGGTLATFAATCEIPRGFFPALVGAWVVERELATGVERSLRKLKVLLEPSRALVSNN